MTVQTWFEIFRSLQQLTKHCVTINFALSTESVHVVNCVNVVSVVISLFFFYNVFICIFVMHVTCE